MIKIELTQEYINELIGTSKRVTKPPKRDYTLERGSYRKDFELYSNEYDECFKAFIRNNHELPDHFSIGLVWITEKAKLNNASPILFRCNGPHGGNQNIPEHFIHHIHSAQLNKYDEENGFYILEKNVQATDAYSTLDSAIDYFCRRCNIIDADKYFPGINQMSLFS